MITDSNGKHLKILAIVPARGGSKGVPMKNIRPLGGIPLIAHTANFICECDFIDRGVVSTDHPEIAQISEAYGLSVPRLRPADLAGDRVGDAPVLNDALLMAEKFDGVQYDIILMLQPTSPIRTKQQILQTLEKIQQRKHDSVWTVSPTDLKFHPDKQLILNKDVMEFYSAGGPGVIARQQLKQTYHRNGIAYALTRDLVVEGKLFGKRPGVVVVDENYTNIDTLEDFRTSEMLLSQLGIGKIKSIET